MSAQSPVWPRSLHQHPTTKRQHRASCAHFGARTLLPLANHVACLARLQERDSRRRRRTRPSAVELSTDERITTANRNKLAFVKPDHYWLSTLPVDITLERMVNQSKLRSRIERDYLDLQQEVGLGHYEGRGWHGFHHHASLCVAAYGFLISECSMIPPQEP